MSNDLNALVSQADKGDKQALAVLREEFTANPSLWEESGNIARQAEHALVRAAAKNPVTQDAFYRKIESMKLELAGPSATPLERLLVERIAACWFQVNYLDAVCFQNMDMSLEKRNYYECFRDRAQKRYLSAVKTLAQVRRLLTPAVQVNIANQQVNTASL